MVLSPNTPCQTPNRSFLTMVAVSLGVNHSHIVDGPSLDGLLELTGLPT